MGGPGSGRKKGGGKGLGLKAKSARWQKQVAKTTSNRSGKDKEYKKAKGKFHYLKKTGQ